ncbi:MAG: HD domain-containing protein [Desulfobulbaceae bacterium]|nr:HD domain-containing protein [Desulfobulbaceae bacterium]
MTAVKRKTLFVRDLQDGGQVADLFLVSRKIFAETKAGKPYLALTLMDNSGEIEARVWEDAEQANEFVEIGRVILIQGLVKQFRDQLQLNINSLRVLEKEDVILQEFMPSSRRPVPEMQAELNGLLDTVEDRFLGLLLGTIFRDDILQGFLTAPAAKMMHHAYLGGLAEHTLSVTRLSLCLCDHYPELDRDLLVAGCLLHDIGKIDEFDFATVPFAYTDSGRLVGHMVLGSETVRKEAERIDGFPSALLNNLIHMILSHHGRHEFGSPCLPMTREAILLHHLDDMDAKMNLIDKLSARVEAGKYQWSDYQRSLERFLLLKGLEEQAAVENHPEDFASDSRQEEGNPSPDDALIPRQKQLF